MTVNGRPALQYEIRATIDKIKVVYLHTTVDGKDFFHQVIGWTRPSSLEKNRPILDSILNSLKEIER